MSARVPRSGPAAARLGVRTMCYMPKIGQIVGSRLATAEDEARV